MDLKLHWDKIYTNAEVEKLGWYEENPQPSISLIEKCNLTKDAQILNVGAGATMLIDYLLQQTYSNLIATDISEVALNTLQNRLGNSKNKLQWIVDDLTNSKKLKNLQNIDLWHDRAVLHFFQTEQEQKNYFDLIKTVLKPNGYVIIGVFNLQSATKCSGLPVFRYDESLLQEKLGDEFEKLEAFNYTYTMPSGALRDYIYALFKRKG